MNYVSTRRKVDATSLAAAITQGLAGDGGLFVPAKMPRIDGSQLSAGMDLASVARVVLRPFFAGDQLADKLDDIAQKAFSFPAPVRAMPWLNAGLLELYHGPTAAFKDFGARFLAASFAALRQPQDKPLTIIVATSGDTGAAVAGAFHGMPGFRVCILYPDGRVSPRQAHQLGCFGDNVTSFAVDGSFDDCQKLVKQALRDQDLQQDVPLSSANSISLGRLLPQMVYYAKVSLDYIAASAQKVNFIIPTGNLGNALAAVWAREIGLPIGDIHLVTNANHTLPDYFQGEAYAPRTSVRTLANAMDVGAPSNFERLLDLYKGDDARLRQAFGSQSVDDTAIEATIRHLDKDKHVLVCPHTATAMYALEHLRAAGDTRHWVVAATAHPAKFDGIVEPLVGHTVEVPPALAELLAREASATKMPADYALLTKNLRQSLGE